MQEVLKQLGITDKNNGTSTGAKWINSNAKTITSFSPVDGKKIADVVCTDKNALYAGIVNKGLAMSVLSFKKFQQADFASLAYSVPLYIKDFYTATDAL